MDWGQARLWIPGYRIGDGSAGNTATDNSWKNALAGDPHLSSGGFAFVYGNGDKYQVYYNVTNKDYEGCVPNGKDCIGAKLTPDFFSTTRYGVPTGAQPVPEPDRWAILLLGLGVVGWQIKRKPVQS